MKRKFPIVPCLAAALLCLFCTPAFTEGEVFLLPSSLEIIGEEAFFQSQCANKVVVPEGVLRIESRAFAQSGISEIVLPPSLNFIAKDAFEGCSGLSASVVPHTYAHQWCIDMQINYSLLFSDAPESIPSYWKTHMDIRIQTISEVLNAAGSNHSAFFWYTDSHWSSSFKCSPMILKYLSSRLPINKTNFGGDIIERESTDPQEMAYLMEWREAVKSIPNHHSVIGNHDDGNGSAITNGAIPPDDIRTFLFGSEISSDVTWGGDFYYYLDDFQEKTRYIYLDTASRYYYFAINSAQKAFLKSSLKSTPNGWHIIVLSHIWRDLNYNTSPPSDIGFSSSANKIITLLDSYNARSGEFVSCGGWVEFCIGGHIHADGDYRSPGGIPVVLTDSDGRYTRSGLSSKSGTITEASVNAIVADYDAHTLHIIRIGRGNSRSVSLVPH